ncbi:MAG: hypothetical protein K940chlam7_02032 [Chlamydiae bacterium]|nr:hypothetical protein [Chlamydiota bacterium]
MMKKFLLTITVLQCLTGYAFADKNSYFLSKATPTHIFVNNRIVARVNEKAVSVVDIMKKMDMLFYRQFPQYASSIDARYQFYQMNWKHVLREIVEKELIMADAIENKVEVSNGDIRQELEAVFGPNIIANLDKAGLTYDEAWEMVKEDLTIRRMLMIRVNSLAVRSVTPSDVRSAYEEYIKENTRPNVWHYQMISIRGADPTLSAEAANHAYQLLKNHKLPLEKLGETLQEHSLVDDKTVLNISEEYHHSEKEIPETNKEILISLTSNSFSKPIAQKSRATNAMVFRIFHLKEMVPGGAPSFNEVENKIRNMLVDKAINKESDDYIAKLRQHFDVQDSTKNQMFDEDFQPFALK